MYKLEYLSVARRDIYDIAKYITDELSNPAAAERLVLAIVSAAEKLTEFPYSNQVFVPIKPLSYEYRRIIVRNYLVFYRVDESKNSVIIARIIYSKRNPENLL